MNLGESEYLEIRDLRYHVRRWGPRDAPPLFLLHGILDNSATFALMAEAFAGQRHLIAPDWRGHGHSDHAPQGYWFPDYLADLDALVAHYAPDTTVVLVGHSMGGQAASLYAGLRPEKVAALVCLDTLNVPEQPPEELPERYRHWLDLQRSPPRRKLYHSFEALAERIRHRNPRVDAERARFIAECWGHRTDDGRVALYVDPWHLTRTPLLYRAAESMAIWKRVRCPVFCLDGAESAIRRALGSDEHRRRRACFRDLRQHALADCGHMIHYEQPRTAAAEIERFLDTEV